VIVQDNIAVAEDSISLREGSRTAVIVMIKDAKRFAASEGWGFESFKGDSHSERTLTATAVTSCVNCHKKNKDMVFSEFRK
jgi:cytochrome c553